ncbi:MAG: TonB-dependent receptor [Gammaproteobacteria bacterium]
MKRYVVTAYPIRQAPWLAAMLVLMAPAHAAEPAGPEAPAIAPHVVVIGRSATPFSDQLDPSDGNAAPAADGAQLVSQANGVSAGRMGGRGLEPVIRGQSQNRINVLVDGAFVFGACPNRMDPPTAFVAVDTWDQVTVVKGVRSLLHGPGGSGGTVLFQRQSRPEQNGWSGGLVASATDNGLDRQFAGDAGWRTEGFFGRVRGQSGRAGNYVDGAGAEVRSAYEEDALSAAFGYTDPALGQLTLAWDGSRARDVLYAGAGMDAPEEDASVWRLEYDGTAGSGGAPLRLEAWRADVDHLMDNYSNRPLATPMAMRVPSTSATTGARGRVDLAAGSDWTVSLGVDLLQSEREAVRYQGPAPGRVTVSNSLMWPDVTLRQTGLVLEAHRTLGPGRLLAGLRYDHNEARADRSAETPMAPGALSPDQLYTRYYGRSAGDENEDLLSALLTWERPVGERTTWFVGASRTARTADATERYLAANHPVDPTRRWVGNPGLDPEVHHQADLGLAWQDDGWDATAAAFYDRVDDYITSDRARAQPGILLADGARIYRNVDAELYGLEGEARIRWGSGWRLTAGAAWVRGTNTIDSRPLYQIPPLNGRVEIGRQADRWELGSRLRWAARQSRADDDPVTGSGLDPRETPGWAVLDVFMSLATRRLGTFRLGVDNLLDTTYADHLNRANQDPFNPDPVQVNEPGRVIWLGWRWSPAPAGPAALARR